jgi:uridine phosphorylase
MMRFDRFSERAQDAAARGYEILQRYGHSQVDTEHIFLGLMEQPDGVVSKLMQMQNADPSVIKTKLDEVLRASPRVNIHGMGTAGQVFITPRVKRLLDLANEEANALKDDYIGVEHLLLGIANERTTPAARILDESGLSKSSMQAAIAQLRAHPEIRSAISDQTFYHIGFGAKDLGANPPTMALLSGDPDRAKLIAETYLKDVVMLSEHRGLNSYVGTLPSGKRLLAATSGMGAPSLSIVVNELVQVGIRQIIRIGTCGSIQAHVKPGSVVITRAALCRQGAANDIAPVEYPAAADPFLTVRLAETAKSLGVDYHVGITASVDSFYEGQERSASANPHLMRWLQGITEEYRHLNILNYEMESGTLFKMAGVYGFEAACICGVIAQRTASESVVQEAKANAVENAIKVAIGAAV